LVRGNQPPARPTMSGCFRAFWALTSRMNNQDRTSRRIGRG
jgi:hypothetical protein